MSTLTALYDWLVVFDEQPNALANVCAGLSAICTRITPASLVVSGGILKTFGGSDDNMDALSLAFGIPALALPGLTFLDWTSSKVPVPAVLFMFAPALLGFLGLQRKEKAKYIRILSAIEK